jgi:hypothetical protein
LIREAEALSSSSEWTDMARKYRDLMDRWKAAGRAEGRGRRPVAPVAYRSGRVLRPPGRDVFRMGRGVCRQPEGEGSPAERAERINPLTCTCEQPAGPTTEPSGLPHRPRFVKAAGVLARAVRLGVSCSLLVAALVLVGGCTSAGHDAAASTSRATSPAPSLAATSAVDWSHPADLTAVLASFPLPTHSRPTAGGPGDSLLENWCVAQGVDDLRDQVGYWTSASTPAGALAEITAHLGPGWWARPSLQEGSTTCITYVNGPEEPMTGDLEPGPKVSVQVVGSSGGSTLRLDAWQIPTSARPAAETLPAGWLDATIALVPTVWEIDGSPDNQGDGQSPGPYDYRPLDDDEARRLAADVNASFVIATVPSSCPIGAPEALLSYRYPDRTVAFTADQDCWDLASVAPGQDNDLPLLALTQQLDKDLLTAAPDLSRH